MLNAELMLIPTSLQHSALIIQHCVVVAIAVTSAAATTTTLRSVGGLPAHIAGRFTELTLCRQRLTAPSSFSIGGRTPSSASPLVPTSRAKSSRSAPSPDAFSGPMRSTWLPTVPSSSPTRPGDAGASSFSCRPVRGSADSLLPGREVPPRHVRRARAERAGIAASTTAVRSS